jgi:long-chain acyl-CoA synthetase
LDHGKNSVELKQNPPKADDCFMLCYTSGTTGDPKGVKLTHSRCIMMVASLFMRQKEHSLVEGDIYISYLPAAHTFEQGLFATTLIYGVKCGFYCGDPI